MSSDMIGFIILDFILGLILRRMVSVPLVVKISRMNRNDGSRHPASFGVPTDMVSNLELLTPIAVLYQDFEKGIPLLLPFLMLFSGVVVP